MIGSDGRGASLQPQLRARVGDEVGHGLARGDDRAAEQPVQFALEHARFGPAEEVVHLVLVGVIVEQQAVMPASLVLA